MQRDMIAAIAPRKHRGKVREDGPATPARPPRGGFLHCAASFGRPAFKPISQLPNRLRPPTFIRLPRWEAEAGKRATPASRPAVTDVAVTAGGFRSVSPGCERAVALFGQAERHPTHGSKTQPKALGPSPRQDPSSVLASPTAWRGHGRDRGDTRSARRDQLAAGQVSSKTLANSTLW